MAYRTFQNHGKPVLKLHLLLIHRRSNLVAITHGGHGDWWSSRPPGSRRRAPSRRRQAESGTIAMQQPTVAFLKTGSSQPPFVHGALDQAKRAACSAVRPPRARTWPYKPGIRINGGGIRIRRSSAPSPFSRTEAITTRPTASKGTVSSHEHLGSGAEMIAPTQHRPGLHRAASSRCCSPWGRAPTCMGDQFTPDSFSAGGPF